MLWILGMVEQRVFQSMLSSTERGGRLRVALSSVSVPFLFRGLTQTIVLPLPDGYVGIKGSPIGSVFIGPRETTVIVFKDLSCSKTVKVPSMLSLSEVPRWEILKWVPKSWRWQ